MVDNQLTIEPNLPDNSSEVETQKESWDGKYSSLSKKSKTTYIRMLITNLIMNDGHKDAEKLDALSEQIVELESQALLSERARVAGKIAEIDLMLAMIHSTTKDTPHEEILQMVGNLRKSLEEL